MKKTFVGWTNIKWLIKELVAMYSGGKSYFSKKRIEGGAAFWLAWMGMAFYFGMRYSTMDIYETILWAGTLFTIGGYNVKKTQDEKTNKDDNKGDNKAA